MIVPLSALEHTMALFHIACVVVVAVAVGFVCLWPRQRLPPGPRGLPIIGNLHQLSQKLPWKQLQEWHKVYGPLITIQAGRKRLIVIGNHKTAHEMLNRRSVVYSSRPRLIAFQDFLMKNLGVVTVPHGPAWKQGHKIQMTLMSRSKCQAYHLLQDVESRQLLFDLLSSDDFEHEMGRYSSSVMLTLLYGKRFATGTEPELREIKRVWSQVLQTFEVSKCDMFPVLAWLPPFLAKWKRDCYYMHSELTRLYQRNTAYALETGNWNWTRQSFEEKKVSHKELLFILGELFEAGGHTTAGVLIVAVLACVSFPDTMRRVQQEVDAQVGRQRLPCFEDIERLSYTKAFAQEVLRWRNVAPAGVAHCALVDDDYEGYRIPKGTSVVANSWSLDMDDQVFERPDDFMPQRWLDEPDLPLCAFGFGKRVCPGQHLARGSLQLVVARMLWAYDISWGHGQEQRLDRLGTTHHGVFAQPSPFKAVFTARSSHHEQVVRRQWQEAEKNVDVIMRQLGAEFSADKGEA